MCWWHIYDIDGQNYKKIPASWFCDQHNDTYTIIKSLLKLTEWLPSYTMGMELSIMPSSSPDEFHTVYNKTYHINLLNSLDFYSINRFKSCYIIVFTSISRVNPYSIKNSYRCTHHIHLPPLAIPTLRLFLQSPASHPNKSATICVYQIFQTYHKY